MRRAPALAALAAAALGAAGCGDRTSITDGGRVAGTTLTVYSLLPQAGDRASASADAVLGEKLALQEAEGRVGELTINFVSADLPAGRGKAAIANVTREVIKDPGIAAVIGDLSPDTARVTVPLFNEAGILHVSPGVATSPPPRTLPTGRRSFAPLLRGNEAAALARAARASGRVAVEATADPAQQALADDVRRRIVKGTVDTSAADAVVVVARTSEDAFGIVDGILGENPRARVLLPAELWQTGLPDRLKGRDRVSFVTQVAAPATGFAEAFEQAYGRAPGPWAQVGYDGMRDVLGAIGRAGKRANSRQALIDAFFSEPAQRAPFVRARRTADGGTIYEPLR